MSRLSASVFAALILVAILHAIVAVPFDPSKVATNPQWLFSYEFGLIKRGLVGELLTKTIFAGRTTITQGELFTVIRLVSIAAFLLSVLVAVLAWIRAQDDWLTRLVVTALLIATPIGSVYYVSNGYYLEVVNLVVLFAYVAFLFARPPAATGLAVLLVACIATTLIHESALLSVAPAMILLHYLTYVQAAGNRGTVAALAVIYLACVGLALYASPHSAAAFEAMSRSVAARVDWEVNPLNLLPLTRSTTENVAWAFHQYVDANGLRPGGWRILLSLLVTGPAILFLSYLLVYRLRPQFSAPALLIASQPFVLTFLADDIYRWYVLVVINLCLASLIPLPEHVLKASARDLPAPSARDLRVGTGFVAVLVAFALPFPYFRSNDGNPLMVYVEKLWRVMQFVM